MTNTNFIKENKMATYECDICGMAVNAYCANCDEPLIDSILTNDDGSKVQVSECPSCEGKIKSPSCCNQDMICNI